MSIKKIPEPENNLTKVGERLLQLEEYTKLKPGKLCKKLVISDAYLSNLKHGHVKKGNYEFWESIRNNFPNWINYLQFKTDTRPEKSWDPQSEEKMIPDKKGGEPVPGSYGMPDFNHQVTAHHDLPDHQYLNMASEILKSKEDYSVMALKNNIQAFYSQIKAKADVKNMKNRLNSLEKEVKSLKDTTSGCAAPANQDVAENE